MRHAWMVGSPVVVVSLAAVGQVHPIGYWALGAVAPFFFLGWRDFFQRRQAIRRNFPVLGWFRYLFELIRPEINQYFVESNTDGRPFSREERSLVYQRAKKVLDTVPFGTQHDVYSVGYEWVNHSMLPTHVSADSLRVKVGSSRCTQPYSSSILNISAMSYGSLSKNAVLALNGGAKDGNFAHNTGEGGVSPYHIKPGGDLIWQIGTGYFGCRDSEGKFNSELFAKQASIPNIKMIEIKISQGAKPGHGGILPGVKVTEEIAGIRGVPVGKDVVSPSAHTAFSTPLELVHFIQQLRELSGGKPVGIKLCVGKRREFMAFAKAMVKEGIVPDFIAVDGGEGGTGAAPLEFSNKIGTPGDEGLNFVHNVLVGMNLRDEIKIFASGKIYSGFGILKRMALGADVTYAARSMMLALGCIQALRCNANVCPAGVATTKSELYAGLDVGDKRRRVFAYHDETVESFAHILGAMGLSSSSDLEPWHVHRRVTSEETRHYGQIYNMIEAGSLLSDPRPKDYERPFNSATEDSFGYAGAV